MPTRPEPLLEPGALRPLGNNFGLLRVVLAALVVVSHSAELLDGDRSREPLTRLFGTIAFGTLAVDGFFVISGFLIVKSWDSRPSVVEFLSKRVLRIYPGFIVASLVSVFVVGRLAEASHVAFSDLIAPTVKNVARLYETEYPAPLRCPHSQRLNGSLWTIRWEFYCYLLAMVLGLLRLSHARWPWILVFFAAAGFVAFPSAFVAILPVKYDAAPRFLASFSAGALFYLYRDKVRYGRLWALASIVGLVASLFSLRFAELGIATFGAYLIFAVAFARAPWAARIGTKNDVSYGMYLYAWPIQQFLVLTMPTIPLPVMILLSLLLSILAGYLSWRSVERPCLAAKEWFDAIRDSRVRMRPEEG